MERYRRFLDWSRNIVVFAAVFSTELILDELKDRGVDVWGTTIVLGLAAIISLSLAEAALKRLVESVGLLRRIIFGNQWIEGLWVDEVVGQGHFALVSFSIENEEVRVRGEQFDMQGSVTATWESCASVLESNTLRTIYRSPQFLQGRPAETSGSSTYVFTGRPGRPPQFYSGSFVDAAEGGRSCQLRGERISDRRQIKRIMNPATRRAALGELASRQAAQAISPPDPAAALP